MQALIDRRFFRARCDAEQALAHFAAGLRQQAAVDLASLVVQTEAVVAPTEQEDAVTLTVLRRASKTD